MCYYMSYINDPENRKWALREVEGPRDHVSEASDDEEDGSIDWKITERLIQEFCQSNYLSVKATKEVHFLSL